MTPDDRAHRILKALAGGRTMPLAQLKRIARDRALDYALDRAKTWDTVCHLGDLSLVVISAGVVRGTTALDQVLEAAERHWAAEGAGVHG